MLEEKHSGEMLLESPPVDQPIASIEQKLGEYLRKACPDVPSDIRDVFTREMLRAFKVWGSVPESERGATLDAVRSRLERKLTRPEQAKFKVSFSKKKNKNEEAIREVTDKYTTELSKVITKYRESKGYPEGQLSFKVDGIDMDHPILAIVQFTAADSLLRKKELRHGKGRLRAKAAGRPAAAKFDFESVEVNTGTVESITRSL